MRTIERLEIENFKSIRHAVLELRDLNVFIGANGSGKSNLLQAFRLMKAGLLANEEALIRMGRADDLMYMGRRHSGYIAINIVTQYGQERVEHMLRWVGNERNDLMRVTAGISGASELTVPRDKQDDDEYIWDVLDRAQNLRQNFAEQIAVYHFHDTTPFAKVRGDNDLHDNRLLRASGENLAAFLNWIQVKHPNVFRRIVETVQLVAPYVGSFILAPSKLEERRISLRWTHAGTGQEFDAYALSDGTLRFICLATLLTQPEPPPIIIVDEPELGLHPAALHIIAELLAAAAVDSQVIVATQSPYLIDAFIPENIWTVQLEDNQSVYRNLHVDELKHWLEDYSLGELLVKNVIETYP